MRRRGVLAAGLSVLAGEAAAQERQEIPPVLFVHGDAGTGAVWMPTIWRFESNTYPRAKLFAADMRIPMARRADAAYQPGRSTAGEATRQLAQEIARVRRISGVDRIALVAHDRAGNIVRELLRESRDKQVKVAILAASPCHGRIISDKHMVGSEFNGASPFLRQLNAMPGEVPPGAPIFTLASDGMDMWAQPEGRFLGLPGVPTGIDATGPALRGATNVVLPGADHMDVAYSAQAFVEQYRIITGEAPQTSRVRAEVRPTLNGKVSGYLAGAPTNIELAGARVRIFVVAPGTGQRIGPPRHDQTTAADGLWGPFDADSETFYEIEVTTRGYPTTHIYRPPIPRSSENMHLRPYLPIAADPKQGALAIVTRPRGLFNFARDKLDVGGQSVAGAVGVPSENTLRIAATSDLPSSVVVTLNGERLVGRTWPVAQRHVSIIEIGE